MKKFLFCTIIIILATTPAFPQGSANGTRISLTEKLNLTAGSQFAQVFIPGYFEPPADGKFVLVFHFHSASWAAEDEVYLSHSNAILFNIHLGALSSPYQTHFQNQSVFGNILDEIVTVLSDNSIIENPTIDKLIVTSFSAGYAAVREIFKNKNYCDRIDALNLADGLHASSYNSSRKEQLQHFLKFAQNARDRLKIMNMTHSSIPTPGYESTTQTANYIIQNIKAARETVSVVDEIGTQTSRCDTGYFHLKGYTGDTASDHMKHLYAMHKMLSMTMEILNTTSVGMNSIQNETAPVLYFRNYPNPFNNATTVVYQLRVDSDVDISVYNLAGQLIEKLKQGKMHAGSHQFVWNASHVSSGLYTLTLKMNDCVQTEKCLLIK